MITWKRKESFFQGTVCCLQDHYVSGNCMGVAILVGLLLKWFEIEFSFLIVIRFAIFRLN